MAYWNNFYKSKGFIGKIALRRMGLQHKGKMKWILSLISMDKISTVLDIGCGNGIFINYIMKHNFQIKTYGLDHSAISALVPKWCPYFAQTYKNR